MEVLIKHSTFTNVTDAMFVFIYKMETLLFFPGGVELFYLNIIKSKTWQFNFNNVLKCFNYIFVFFGYFLTVGC